MKKWGPPHKAKYYLVIDSEIVPWGKGEKNPGRGVKENLKPYVYKQTKHVKVRCRTYWRTVRRVADAGKVKEWSSGAEAKASLNRASSQHVQTRNRVTYPCPGWSGSKIPWRTGSTSVEKGGNEVWIGEKFQSNPEIAGSPRNSFRASLMQVLRR